MLPTQAEEVGRGSTGHCVGSQGEHCTLPGQQSGLLG